MRTLYHTIDLLLTPDSVIHEAGLLISDTVIERVIRGGERPEADRSVDCRGKIAMPGLKNGHAHSAMTLLRGYADDMLLHPWLTEKIWPLEAKLTEEHIYHGVRLACLEMIKSGTTFCGDMYFHTDASMRAYRESGMRVSFGPVIFDFFDSGRAERSLRETEELIARFGPEGSEADPKGKVLLAVAPHSIYTVSSGTLRRSAELAGEHGMTLHIHLSETEKELRDCLAENGVRPARYLDSLGVLGSGCAAAHCVHLDEAEMDLLAERGVTVVHNPASNMKTSAGSCFPWRKLRERGVGIMMGTDGCASNNALDLFSDGRLAGLLQKHHFGDPTLLPAKDIVAMLTGAGSGAFPGVSGRLEAGAPADFILLDASSPRLTPVHNPYSSIAYSAGESCVDTVVCGGEVLMAGGHVPGEEAITAAARQAAEELLRSRP